MLGMARWFALLLVVVLGAGGGCSNAGELSRRSRASSIWRAGPSG